MENPSPGFGTNRRVDVIWPRCHCFSPTSQNFDGIYSAPLVDVPPENIKSGFSTFSQGSAKKMLFKLNPNVLRIEEKPFDPKTFAEEDNLTTLAVRYRLVQTSNGTTSIESNARIVKWSDGSKQLLVGDRAFDIVDDIPRKLLRGITISQVSGKASGQQTSIAEDFKENLVQIKQEQEDLCMRQEQEEFPARQELVELPTRQERGDLLNRVKQFHLHVRQALVRQEKVEFHSRKEAVNSRTIQEHVNLRRRQDIDLHTRQEHPNLQMGQVHASIQPQEPGIDEGEDEDDPATGEGEDESDPEIDEWEYESDPDEDPDYIEDQ